MNIFSWWKSKSKEADEVITLHSNGEISGGPEDFHARMEQKKRDEDLKEVKALPVVGSCTECKFCGGTNIVRTYIPCWSMGSSRMQVTCNLCGAGLGFECPLCYTETVVTDNEAGEE